MAEYIIPAIVAAVAVTATATTTGVQAAETKKASKRQRQSERERMDQLKKSATDAESARIGKIAMEQTRNRRRRQASAGGQPSTIFAGRQGGQRLGSGDTSAKTLLGA